MSKQNVIEHNWLQPYIERLDMHIAKSEKELARFTEEMAKLREDMKTTNQHLGGLSNSLGECAEDFFYEALYKQAKNLFGESYHRICRNEKGVIIPDEYDILMINNKSVCIIEIKHNARSEDIPKLLNKAKSLRINMPEYQNHTIYFGLASMAFKPHIVKLCKDNGIAIIKQDGDSLVIIDDNLKGY